MNLIPELADDVRHAWKWLSVQVGAIVAISPELYQQIGALREFVPQSLFNHAMAVCGLVVIYNSVRKKATA